MKRWLFLSTVWILAACATAAFPPERPGEPPAHDARPAVDPAYTITLDRPIEDVRRRTVGFPDGGVWFSNEMAGGWLDDVWLEQDTLFVARVRPENAPINNSAWYAFKVWSQHPRTIALQLRYEDGRHRYWPKLRAGVQEWAPMAAEALRVDTAANTATLRLHVGPDTLWVAGQELLTSAEIGRWMAELALVPHVAMEDIGSSRRGRPIHMLTITDDPEASRHVLLIGRQHPPEVTGNLAMLRFVDEVAGESALAREFRRHFQVLAVPLVNPDGVDLGHWRHSTGGVDLNRDWVAFHQPETRAVRDAFLRIRDDAAAEVWFAADFHSTRRDVFYTLDRELETVPPGFIDRWLQRIARALPDYEVADSPDSPSDMVRLTADHWFYREFGAPAVTYEVGDNTDPALLRSVATAAARAMMELLLQEAGAGVR